MVLIASGMEVRSVSPGEIREMKPKPKIPSPCPKCGVRCEGYREAKRHCRNKKREANFFKVKA